MIVLRDLDLKFEMGHLVIPTTPTQITKLRPNSKQLGSRPFGHYDCHDFVWSKKNSQIDPSLFLCACHFATPNRIAQCSIVANE
jgi:hypothetical protein